MRRGRHRKAAPRHPGGKLIQPVEPIEPNPIVLAHRYIATGNRDAEPNPLNIALSRRWITEDQHRTAERYAGLYRRAGFDLPSLAAMDLARTSRATSHAFGDPEAMDRLQSIWTRLRTPIIRELFATCVLHELPRWMLYRLKGERIAPSPWELNRGWLLIGLDVAADTLDRRTNERNFRNAG